MLCVQRQTGGAQKYSFENTQKIFDFDIGDTEQGPLPFLPSLCSAFAFDKPRGRGSGHFDYLAIYSEQDLRGLLTPMNIFGGKNLTDGADPRRIQLRIRTKFEMAFLECMKSRFSIGFSAYLFIINSTQQSDMRTCYKGHSDALPRHSNAREFHWCAQNRQDL